MHKLFIFLLMFFIGDSAHSLLSDKGRGVIERIPIGDKMVLEIRKEPAHIFLAEYDLTFILNSDGSERARIVFYDTGGHSRIDVFRSEDRTVFQHGTQTVCLNVRIRKFSYLCDFNPNEAVEVGYFGFDNSWEWRFIPKIS